MSDLAVTSRITDRQRTELVTGQVLPPAGTTAGFVLTANADGTSSWQAAAGGGGLTQIFDSTLTGSAANFDITGIAGTFNHLHLRYLLRTDNAANQNIRIRFNNDSTAADYQDAGYQTNGTAALSPYEELSGAGIFAGNVNGTNATNAAMFSMGTADINAYRETTAWKYLIYHASQNTNTTTGNFVLFNGIGVWKNTAAITRVTVVAAAGSFVAGSHVSLYGLT